MYTSLILIYDSLLFLVLWLNLRTCYKYDEWAVTILLATLKCSVRETHTSFFPAALRAPQMSVFHSVNFTAFFALASEFSMTVVVCMGLNSCRRAVLAASLWRRCVRELTERLCIPVEAWVLQWSVGRRIWRRHSWFRPRALHHVEMRLSWCRREGKGRKEHAIVAVIV